MNNIKEILKNISEDDFKYNLIDLHIHTNLSDGLAEPLDILKNAKKNNYKYISITDHNTFDAHKFIKDDILITGAEFDCWYKGIFIHLLAYGIDINKQEFQPFIAKNRKNACNTLTRLFSKRNVPALINTIHDAGGVAVLAHPACYWAINLEHFVKKLIDIGLDGIEVYYPYPRFRKIVKFHSEKSIINIAQKYPMLIRTGGSDFHSITF